MQINEYRICNWCVMDTTDPQISFDENGICNHCKESQVMLEKISSSTYAARQLELGQIVEEIKKVGEKNEYDCIIGLSGGVDSSYLAYLAKKLGLRVLAIHVDTGWNSELAVKNIELLVRRLGIDLYTFVVDWPEMRDLQLSFLKAAVANQDTPQDHVIHAALHRVAVEKKISYILSGSNYSTECILPKAWGHSAMDLRQIKAIQKKYGTVKLKKFPQLGLFKYYIYYPYIRRLKTIKLLNYYNYVKSEAMQVLEQDLGWRYYGGKHYESVFTKFFQSYYLPEKFGFDKRKAHLASLIASGQMTRDDALVELQQPLYNEKELVEDKGYICKKLGLTVEKFDELLSAPNKHYLQYPSGQMFFKIKGKLGSVKRYLKRIISQNRPITSPREEVKSKS